MARSRHHRFVWWAGLGIVLVLATVFRLHDLGSESLWLDEGVTWARTLAGPMEIVADSAARDTHPPLYYLVVDAWTAVAGHSAWALRAPSLVFSVATIPVVYVLGRDLFDRRAGLLGGLLVGLVEFQIAYGQEARMYAMVGFLAATATLAHHRLMSQGASRRRLAAYLASTVLLVYTHVLGWLIVGALWIHWLVGVQLTGANDWDPASWAGSQLAVCLAFVPWAIPLLGASSRVTGGFWAPDVELVDLWETLTVFADNVPLAAAMGVLALVALTARHRGYAQRLGDWWRDRGLLLTWFVAPAVGLYVASKLVEPLYIDRYLIGASPALYLLAARGATALDGRAVRAALVGLLLVGAGASAYASLGDDTREGWKGAAGLIDERARTGELVVFEASYTQIPFDFYSEAELDKRGYEGTHWLAQDQTRFDDPGQLDPRPERIWVVLAHTDERTLPALADDPEYSRAQEWTQFPEITIERWHRYEQSSGG